MNFAFWSGVLKRREIGKREMRSWLSLLFSSHCLVSFKSAFSESNEGPDAIHRVRWFLFAPFFVPSRPKDATWRERKRMRERELLSKPNSEQPQEYYTHSHTCIFIYQIQKCRDTCPRITLPVRIRTGSSCSELKQNPQKNVPDKIPLIDHHHSTRFLLINYDICEN